MNVSVRARVVLYAWEIYQRIDKISKDIGRHFGNENVYVRRNRNTLRNAKIVIKIHKANNQLDRRLTLSNHPLPLTKVPRHLSHRSNDMYTNVL